MMQNDPLSLYREKIGCSIEELAADLEKKAKTISGEAVCLFRVKEASTLQKKLKLKESEDIAAVDDIYGFRILANSTSEIYDILSVIASSYPGYLDHDYVAEPKKRQDRPGKALRLVQYIVERNGLTFEVQLTTPAWNEINEELHAEYHKRRYGD